MAVGRRAAFFLASVICSRGLEPSGGGPAAQARASEPDCPADVETDDTALLQLRSATSHRAEGSSRQAEADLGAALRGKVAHHWPHVRGKVPGPYSHTDVKAPANLSAALAWSWHHPEGRYFTVVAGSSVIDSQKNIYLSTNEAVRKFDIDGNVLWEYKPPSTGGITGATMVNSPTLMGNHLYQNTQGGLAICLDIETGLPVWIQRVATEGGGDCGYPSAYEGIYVMGTSAGVGGGNWDVVALNGTSGDELWRYRTDLVTWNLMPVYPGDDSVLFMDQGGGVYRLGLHDGSLLWHYPSGEDNRSITDGGIILSPDGTATYSCSNPGNSTGQEGQAGVLRAFELQSGRKLWEQVLPQPCNSWPVVAHLGGDDLSVLVTIGSFLKQFPKPYPVPHHGGMMVFDAKTGVVQYKWQAPVYYSNNARGDTAGMMDRLSHDLGHFTCWPAQWSAPTVTADGVVLAGRVDGFLYALRSLDKSKFESIELASSLPIDYANTTGVEVTKMELGSAFLHGGTAWAPGMMSIASCDTLYVFRFEEAGVA